MNEDNTDSNDFENDAVETEEAVVTSKREPTEYEKELRAEAAKQRKKNEALKKESAAQIEALKAEFNETLNKREQTYRERSAMSELKAHATKANILDLDVLKLLDRSKITFDEDGAITNAAELIEEFRSAKPHLFSSTTSVATIMPRPKEPTSSSKIDWKSMSESEKKAKRRELGL